MKYDWVYCLNLYNKDQIQKINKIAESLSTQVSDNVAKYSVKTAEVKSIRIKDFDNLLEPFVHITEDLNRYNFGFHTFQTIDTEYINYNVYDSTKQAEYTWHADGHKDEPLDIKLTAILNLSEDEYEGGDFEVFVNGAKTIEEIRQPGSVLVFPGYIQHRVTPVLSGRRITISRWITGPNWK